MSGSNNREKPGRGKRGEGVTIVIRREEVSGGGHHGGAWKVAYADFVTAMMAFFLLMWLLNATTEEQRRGLADYFSPTNLFGRSVSGSGAPFAGTTPNVEGNMVSNMGAVRIENGPRPAAIDVDEDESDTPAQESLMRDAGPNPQSLSGLNEPVRVDGGAAQTAQVTGKDDTLGANGGPGSNPDAVNQASLQATADRDLRAEVAKREAAEFEQAANQIRQAVAGDPALADLAKQLQVEQVQEGLRIQLLDAERQPMFASSVGAPNERGRELLQRVAQAIARLPNNIAISGHTDSTPFRGGGRSNWDLSAERAQATRKLLIDAGVSESRIRSISGNADRDPLTPEDTASASNRRVSVLLIRREPSSMPMSDAGQQGQQTRQSAQNAPLPTASENRR
jgi:chemotaxis protein MotB